jgi:hypothetical protein
MIKLRILGLGLAVAAILVLTACSKPAIPHPVEGRNDCLACHSADSSQPIPTGHAKRNYTNQRCTECHKEAAKSEK